MQSFPALSLLGQPVGVGMFQNMIKGGWIKSYIEPVVLFVDS